MRKDAKKSIFVIRRIANMKRFSCLGSIIISLVLCNDAWSRQSQSPYATAVNIAGKQRMLSQKISKEILLIKLHPSDNHNLAALTDTATQFNEAQLGLIYGSQELGLPKTTEPAHLQKLHDILKLWQEYYAALENSVASKTIDEKLVHLVSETSDQLLLELDEMVLIFQQVATQKLPNIPPTLPETINLSGRQRMLSQKMTKECLLIEANLNADDNKLKLAESRHTFDNVLTGLMRGSKTLNLQIEPTFTLKQQLKKVSQDWRSFNALLDSCGIQRDASAQAAFLEQLSHQNLVVLRSMNRAVEMYESLAYQ